MKQADEIELALPTWEIAISSEEHAM